MGGAGADTGPRGGIGNACNAASKVRGDGGDLRKIRNGLPTTMPKRHSEPVIRPNPNPTTEPGRLAAQFDNIAIGAG